MYLDREVYLYDDGQITKIWAITPINDDSYKVEYNNLHENTTTEIKNFNSKDEYEKIYEFQEEIRNKKIEGYRRTFDEDLEPSKFERIKVLQEKLKAEGFSKKTWVPITENKDGGVTNSKFSGKPFLCKGEKWPQCGLCSHPLQLLIQINLEELPEEKRIFGKGLLQLFFCTNDEFACFVDMASYNDPPPHQILRVINDFEENDNIEIPDNMFTPQIIREWKFIGLEFPYFLPENIAKDLKEDELIIINNSMEHIFDGEKIGGYPLFLQANYIPACPDCNKEMEIVIQIGSDINIPFMFGDGGVGHISLCPEHKNRSVFYWSCS
jgi:uncharacterized protein YwqG